MKKILKNEEISKKKKSLQKYYEIPRKTHLRIQKSRKISKNEEKSRKIIKNTRNLEEIHGKTKENPCGGPRNIAIPHSLDCPLRLYLL